MAGLMVRYFFLREGWVDEVSRGVVEVEGVHGWWEELSESSVFFHLLKNFVYFGVSFFFGVLLVEDAELFVF
jgi:hypothetical protein